jgi:multidrug efflux pump subunit AcrB
VESKEALVAVRYRLSEQSPERLEKMVMEPVERILIALARVSSVTSTASHGYVDFAIRFERGATEQDLAIVEKQVEQIVFGCDVAITSQTVLLACVAAAE